MDIRPALSRYTGLWSCSPALSHQLGRQASSRQPRPKQLNIKNTKQSILNESNRTIVLLKRFIWFHLFDFDLLSGLALRAGPPSQAFSRQPRHPGPPPHNNNKTQKHDNTIVRDFIIWISGVLLISPKNLVQN